jgi:hypothetical protein
MASKKKVTTAAAPSKGVAKKKVAKPDTALTVTETEFAHVVAEPATPTPTPVAAAKPDAQPKDGTDAVKEAWALEQAIAVLGPHAEVWIATKDENGKDFRTPRFRIGVRIELYSDELQKRWAKYVEDGRRMWGVGSNWTGAVNFMKSTMKRHPHLTEMVKIAA